MFWRWNSEYEYMDRESGTHLSQTERLSQLLFSRTFWGDYGGDIISRYHYSIVEENAGNIIYKATAMHGQGFVLFGDFAQHRDETRWLMDFLAADFTNYPIYDEVSFSEFEWELTAKEIGEGFWGEEYLREVSREIDRLSNWEISGDDLIPEQNSTEFWEMVGTDWYGYWESADSLIVEDVPTPEESAKRLLAIHSGDYSEVQLHQDETLF